jgi:nicotinamidase-related amidase
MMEYSAADTAIVITDPQNDFLSPDGVTWELVGNSVTENGTVEHIQALLEAAKGASYDVFISPHYYFPTDGGWKFGGTVENMMHDISMFNRKGALTTDGFEGSGADWLDQYKPLINDGKTIVVSPHKVYGPETNDLVLACPPISALRGISGNSPSKGSRSRWSRTPPPLLSIQTSVMATRRR